MNDNCILVWPAQANPHDPTTHFWFALPEHLPERLCDGGLWAVNDSVDEDPDEFRVSLPCKYCLGIYLEDKEVGRKTLHLLTRAPCNSAPTWWYSIHPGGTPSKSEGSTLAAASNQAIMPRIYISTFLRYLQAPNSQKEKQVREFRLGQADQDLIRQRDYYLPFRGLSRRYLFHPQASTDAFEKALPVFLTKEANKLDRGNRQQKVDNYSKLGNALIELFRRRRITVFPLPEKLDIEIEGLLVNVNADVGLVAEGNYYISKVWLTKPPPKLVVQQAVTYFMELAQAKDSLWLPHWRPGLLDVWR